MSKEKIMDILRSATPANDDNQIAEKKIQETHKSSNIKNIKIAARDIKINHNRVNINANGLIISTILALTMAWIFFQTALK